MTNVRKALRPFYAENINEGQEWQLALVDLGGGGDGAPFVIMMRLGNEAVPDVALTDTLDIDFEQGEDGSIEEEPFTLLSGGGEEKALTANSPAALDKAFQLGFAPDSPDAPKGWETFVGFIQTALAGGSSGHPFTSVRFGFREVQPPNVG